MLDACQTSAGVARGSPPIQSAECSRVLPLVGSARVGSPDIEPVTSAGLCATLGSWS